MKTFAQLATPLRDHFKPTRSKIAEIYRFHSAGLQQGQSIADFVRELKKKLAGTCEFTNEQLNDNLRFFVDYVHNMSSRNSCQKKLPSKEQ